MTIKAKLEPLVDRFQRFLDEPIRFESRILLALLVVPLVLSFTQPLWRISMEAPQYPQGLYLDVYAYKLGAGHEGRDLREINALNHYIGMRTIERSELADLDWIPFALGLMVILTLRAAAIGGVRSVVDLSVLMIYIGAFSLARFILMLYTFGHDLDPSAALTIDPFMPAVFGTKQIANFTTSSFPRGGTAWLAVYTAGVVGIAAWHLWTGYREAWGKGSE